ncbi:ubiquinol:cytochrome c oxidoreductase 8 kDa subunit [Dunaliella salina]|uniref:Cytochrome b-c1 complex subunit 6 n=1 Tax=Dunaliella salina TaxID=3046 RepID=A0ABQ7GTE0_DUNSA|nr:ubiquinol:cytochrome c oxidoreductase 8 kDa subunit [Dunaliella salina]|eukprot:KAF5837872.1 ubiquinol:cytochrome c oxidoreductase 8 kDa subunit [Dunaliella salina]
MSDNAVYTEEDQKPQIEEECKPHCVKQWQEYKACVERIQGDTTGQAHCSGQYFDFWHCVDHCAAPKIFSRLK